MVDEVRFLNQRFQSVHIGLLPKEDGGKVNPLLVVKFYWGDDPHGIMIRYINIMNNSDTEDHLFNEGDYMLDCPKTGMVQSGKCATYIKRVPDRQWKRGYNTNIIRRTVLSYYEADMSQIRLKGMEHKTTVNSVYNPTHTTLLAGLQGFKDGSLLSFTVSNKFAIGIKRDSKFPILYYKEWEVGWVDGEETILPKKSHHLFEELSQYLICRRV